MEEETIVAQRVVFDVIRVAGIDVVGAFCSCYNPNC